MRILKVTLLSALLLSGLLVTAQESDDETIVVPRLRLGDTAPPLKVVTYINGEEVDFDKGRGKNIYVIEFWATWCPPCRESVPHLSKLQAKYRDDNVIVVGISMEDEKEVETFAEKMGEKMDYVVCVDDDDYTTNHYMGGFERTGIPHAFVINRKGRFAWEGHPMMVEEGIELVLSDDEGE
jgi:thiol-disulfide isomerase/thioredoxin